MVFVTQVGLYGLGVWAALALLVRRVNFWRWVRFEALDQKLHMERLRESMRQSTDPGVLGSMTDPTTSMFKRGEEMRKHIKRVWED